MPDNERVLYIKSFWVMFVAAMLLHCDPDRSVRSVVGLLRGGLYSISCQYNLEGLEYIARRSTVQIENRSEMPFLLLCTSHTYIIT